MTMFAWTQVHQSHFSNFHMNTSHLGLLVDCKRWLVKVGLTLVYVAGPCTNLVEGYFNKFISLSSCLCDISSTQFSRIIKYFPATPIFTLYFFCACCHHLTQKEDCFCHFPGSIGRVQKEKRVSMG